MTNSILSLRDLAYNQAKAGDTITEQARIAIDSIAGFPADVPAEAKAELYAGYQLRYNDNNPAVTYAVIGGHYVVATPEQVANKKVEKVDIGVAFAFSYSSQEFGKMKADNPGLHSVVGAVRNDFATYASNRLADLRKAAKKLLNQGQTTQRQTLDFVESITKMFEAQEKSVKVKQNKGDTTANAAKFKAAVDAFWNAYK